MSDCEHADVHIHVNCHRSGDTNVQYLEFTAYCKACDVPFRFPGMGIGSSPERPMSSPDRLEARIPMLPNGESVTGRPAGYEISSEEGTLQ